MVDDSHPQWSSPRHTNGAQGPGAARPGQSPGARARLGEGSARWLSPAGVAEIRRRIRDGAYDTPDVLRVVADRILGSGDLRF